MFPHFQKHLNPQVRINKLVNNVVCHRFPSRLASGIHPFVFLLNSLWFYLSPKCLLNFLWLVYSTMWGKNFLIYGFHISRKCIESINFCSCPSPPLRTLGRVFENMFPPRRKRWRKLWFALSKFYQKIWRWLGTLVYLHFIWFVIFLNVMALQYFE